MSKRTSYQTSNGEFTGKTVTTSYGDGCTKSTHYGHYDSPHSLIGPNWYADTTTTSDSKGNSRTTKY